VEKRKLLPLPGLELRPLGRPARSQSLYLLSRLRLIIVIFLIGVLFSREDKSDTLLRKVCGFLSNYTALEPGSTVHSQRIWKLDITPYWSEHLWVATLVEGNGSMRLQISQQHPGAQCGKKHIHHRQQCYTLPAIGPVIVLKCHQYKCKVNFNSSHIC
jgi:hypothetical protein